MIPGIVSSFRRGSAPPTPAHAWWRLNTSVTGQANYVGITELEFRQVVGTPEVASGGTAIAQQTFPGSSADNLFDGSSGGSGLSAMWANDGVLPAWVGYHFADDIDVLQVAIAARGDAPQQAPVTFLIEYSDDGIAWFTAWSVANAGTWSAGETKVFTRP